MYLFIGFFMMVLPVTFGKASVRPFRPVVSVCRSVGGGVLSFDGINGTGAGFAPCTAEERSVGKISGSRCFYAVGEGTDKELTVRSDRTACAVHHAVAPLTEKEIARRGGVASVGHLPGGNRAVEAVITAAQIDFAVYSSGVFRGTVEVIEAAEQGIGLSLIHI